MMEGIIHIRIDDRLIHGQVANSGQMILEQHVLWRLMMKLLQIQL